MGCDIHLYKEKKVNGQWLTADVWTKDKYSDDDNEMVVDYENQFSDRNYQLFGLLSKGVRHEHPFSFEPRGMPFNACNEYLKTVDSWGSDGHSHSYLYLDELKEMRLFIESATNNIKGMKDANELAEFKKSIAGENPNWELLWPYCQMTNQSSYVHFEVNIPASLYMAEPLDKIISSFNGIEGENHRIVFFFDN